MVRPFAGRIIVATLSIAVLGFGSYASASQHCPLPVAQVVSTFGVVEYLSAATQDWQPAELAISICAEDSIRTGEESRAAIIFPGTDTILRIDQNTLLTVKNPRDDRPSLLDVLSGSLHFFSRTRQALEVRTPFVNAGVEGTEFFVGVTENQASIVVFEGRVVARNDFGEISITDNQTAQAVSGQAPVVRAVASPRDSVQWTLFFPPVFTDPASPALSALLRDAAHLLAAGRANEARAALEVAPQIGDVLALRAVIAVVLGTQEEALELGRQAVTKSPDSAAAKIALSYAQQAGFNLEAARETVIAATEQQPEDALAWTRLAQLWLSSGYRDRALEAAEIAAMLAPRLSRTHMVLGYAYLTQIRPTKAKEAFAKAIALDSQDPLPRLGLGLAKIRDGALNEGRRDIEIAAALDPGSAVVRSYLGKAYFEEGSDIFSPGYFHDFFAQRRYHQAATQFSIAKELDPNDPTPWFYDAILKQTRNDPVGALQDIKKSIELNDNRAVYRSRLLLDQDRAARGVSLGRVYDDLGFEQLAVVESARSLSVDTANHSAHRFLSDSYRSQPRHEIARASELLQAQLLQPINIRPVQPQIAETDLNVLAGVGPAEAAFNEFAPLFERDRLRLDASGMVGNNNTLSDEAVVSWTAGPASFSAGQFHYESNGFRQNNDLEHDIYNFFTQARMTDDLDLQFEYRHRDTEHGDLRLNFDPNDFSESDRRTVEQRTPRIGLHYAASPRSDIIASFLHTKREVADERAFVAGPDQTEKLTTEGSDGQFQYLFQGDRFNVTTGAGYSDLDVEKINILDFSDLFGGVCPPAPPFFGECEMVTVTDQPLDQSNAYLYGNINWPSDMIWTFAASYDSFEFDPIDVDSFNPKVGLQWNFLSNARLRLAYMKTVKRSLIVNQTLEPTQVAGFNQFFDDLNGTEAQRYGIGLDASLPNTNLDVGLEFTWRDLDIPSLLNTTRAVIEDQHEEFHRAYFYWTFGEEMSANKWAVSAEVQFEKFKRKDPPELSDPQDLPTKVETTSVPLAVRYFRTKGVGTGFFAELGASYVNQEIDPSPISAFDQTSDDFVLVDAAIGYRLPSRLGLVSLEARNLLDEEFLYQDVNIQRAEPSNPRFFPERTVLFRMTLNF